jgi:hypothetical protein
MAVKELLGSYVRNNYPNKVPLLPRGKSSKKWQEKEWGTELSVPELWQTVPAYVSKGGLPTGDERTGIKAVSA